MLRCVVQKDSSGDGFREQDHFRGSIVIQTRDAEVGGMGRWRHSGDAKGTQSPGPVAKLDM